ncbi:MAG: hypothetical protein SPI30_08250 [Prevotella sp.]|nr:hypothetical protein [Prevotella sp.]
MSRNFREVKKKEKGQTSSFAFARQENILLGEENARYFSQVG